MSDVNSVTLVLHGKIKTRSGYNDVCKNGRDYDYDYDYMTMPEETGRYYIWDYTQISNDESTF